MATSQEQSLFLGSRRRTRIRAYKGSAYYFSCSGTLLSGSAYGSLYGRKCYGISAVLVEKWKSEEHVISYASRALTEADRNYSASEREYLAVAWAISKFRPYLFGRPFARITCYVGSLPIKIQPVTWRGGI